MSSKPGAGQTLDHIFLQPRTVLQELKPQTHVAFAAPTMKQRLSDHFGIEATMNLQPAPTIAGVVRSVLVNSPVAADLKQVTYVRGE
jgi:hypothetical protein